MAAIAKMYSNQKKRSKRMGMALAAVAAFLAIFLAVNFSLTFLAAELAKDTEVEGPSDTLSKKGSSNPVLVGTSLQSSELTSYANEAALQELRYFDAVSPTGTSVRVQIQAYMRIPAGQCREPIVKFVTPVGSIHVEGTALECASPCVPPCAPALSSSRHPRTGSTRTTPMPSSSKQVSRRRPRASAAAACSQAGSRGSTTRCRTSR